jgi:ribosomal protein L29
MSDRISIIELERMTPSELNRDLKGKRAELAKTRLNLAMGSEKNHAKYRVMKRDIARMEMVRMAMEKNQKGQTIQKSQKNVERASSASSESSESSKKTSKPSKKPVKKAAK